MAMEVRIGSATVAITKGDITREKTVAIVNAANETLLGGGGVDGAIHRAGGPTILEECKKIGGCRTGNAVMTTGGDLSATHVIHTVGPVWRGGSRGEPDLLASCYRKSLEIASERGVRSVAFPSISTGAYRYPIEEAAGIAVREVAEYVQAHPEIEEVRFVLFSEKDLEVYLHTIERYLQRNS